MVKYLSAILSEDQKKKKTLDQGESMDVDEHWVQEQSLAEVQS